PGAAPRPRESRRPSPPTRAPPPPRRRARSRPGAAPGASCDQPAGAEGGTRRRSLQLLDEGAHRGTIPARAPHEEIVALLRDGREPEPAVAGDDIDGDAEVGASLGDGRRDGMVR